MALVRIKWIRKMNKIGGFVTHTVSKPVWPNVKYSSNVFVLSTAGESETHEEPVGSAGFDLSPGEKSEREYLLALSAQYQVERYQDCYSLMGQSCMCL